MNKLTKFLYNACIDALLEVHGELWKSVKSSHHLVEIYKIMLDCRWWVWPFLWVWMLVNLASLIIVSIVMTAAALFVSIVFPVMTMIVLFVGVIVGTYILLYYALCERFPSFEFENVSKKVKTWIKK